MLRGDIRLVTFDAGRSEEIGNQRPGVIVSNDAVNTTAMRLGRGVVTVVPIGAGGSRVYPFQVALPADAVGLDADAKAQAEKVTSVAVDRVGDKLGSVPVDLLQKLDEALRLHLAL